MLVCRAPLHSLPACGQSGSNGWNRNELRLLLCFYRASIQGFPWPLVFSPLMSAISSSSSTWGQGCPACCSSAPVYRWPGCQSSWLQAVQRPHPPPPRNKSTPQQARCCWQGDTWGPIKGLCRSQPMPCSNALHPCITAAGSVLHTAALAGGLLVYRGVLLRILGRCQQRLPAAAKRQGRPEHRSRHMLQRPAQQSRARPQCR